jgi:hypothetical protein
MKNFLSTALALLSAIAPAAAQDTKPAPISINTGASGGAPTPAKAIVTTTDENVILKGAELKTDWSNARNPFRFEANDTPAYAPERVEQMQVLGFSKMPDQNGILQTYAFVTKTTEGPRVQASKPEAKAAKEVYVLRALPEKLDEETVTTEEQVEECSIALGSEQLWFLGVVQTNTQTLALFIPDTATYPIKEEELRPFEIQDSLKDLHVRVTKAGEKITTEATAPRTFARPKSKSTPAKPDTTLPAPVTKPAATPASSKPEDKPIIQGSSPKAVEGTQ